VSPTKWTYRVCKSRDLLTANTASGYISAKWCIVLLMGVVIEREKMLSASYLGFQWMKDNERDGLICAGNNVYLWNIVICNIVICAL